jgi:hypothetical protein
MNQRYVEASRSLISPTGYVFVVALDRIGVEDSKWSIEGLGIEIWRGARGVKCYGVIFSAT